MQMGHMRIRWGKMEVMQVAALAELWQCLARPEPWLLVISLIADISPLFSDQVSLFFLIKYNLPPWTIKMIYAYILENISYKNQID